ncbi:MAG: YdeI/OmpD-associated family protein [Agriterribacter sp.]
MAAIEITNVVYPKNRKEWRKWLSKNFATEKEVWVAIPKQNKTMEYNDIIEEALCFNWIDSTLKTLDENHTAQRMSPRKTKGAFSQLNIERLILLLKQDLIHPQFKTDLEKVANAPFKFPTDIMAAIKADKTAWKFFQAFSDAYKRIRVASIDLARGEKDLFQKRLNTFIENCRKNKLMKGGSGFDKYY